MIRMCIYVKLAVVPNLGTEFLQKKYLCYRRDRVLEQRIKRGLCPSLRQSSLNISSVSVNASASRHRREAKYILQTYLLKKLKESIVLYLNLELFYFLRIAADNRKFW